MTALTTTGPFDLRIDVGKTSRTLGVNLEVTQKGIQGWTGGGVAVRSRSTARLNQHGDFSEAGKRGARLVTISGAYWADTVEEAAGLVDTLNALLADGEEGKLTIADPAFGTRWAYCQLIGTPDVEWDGTESGTFSIDLKCPDPRKYGADEQELTTGVATSGGGASVNPFFGPPQTVTYRRNLMSNPKMAIDTTGWVGQGGGGTPTPSRLATGGPNAATPAFLRLTAAGALTYLQAVAPSGTILVTPGTAYAMEVKARTSLAGAGVALYVQWFDSTDTLITTSSAAVGNATANTWQTWAFTTSAAPAGAYTAQVIARTTGTYAAAGTLDVTAALLGDAPGTYFDGDNAASGTDPRIEYNWADTAGASVSIEASTDYAAGAGGYQDFGEGGSSGTVTWRNAGTADVSPLFRVDGPALGFTITEIETERRTVFDQEIPAGQYLEIDPGSATATLNGNVDRSDGIALAQWPVIPGKATRTFMIESVSAEAVLTVKVAPAWW